LCRYIGAAFHYSRTGEVAPPWPEGPPQTVAALPAAAEESDEADDGLDHRETVSRQIKARRGQRQFRDALRERFDNRCAISGCAVLDVLEAAHIKPYRGERDNNSDNGLLLRADLHILFDLDLMGIHPDTLLVEFHPTVLRAWEYRLLEGCQLLQPHGRPLESALRLRWDQFQKARRSE
jgi:predicted restriction endonuclease